MGAEFSLIREPLPPPPRRRRHRRMHRLHNYTPPSPPQIAYPDSSTRANTLANRSPTPVSKHVALARLADRLASMGKSKREHVIEQLHIPQDMLREVRRYTPSNSFGSNGDVDDWISADQMERVSPGGSGTASVCSDGDEVDSELSASPDGKRRRKIVSFAKYAEMRLFRD